MIRFWRSVIGAVSGLAVSFLLYFLLSLIGHFSEGDWWVMLLVFAIPTITGIIKGASYGDWFELWKVILSPVGAGLAVLVLLFVIAIIHAFATMTFLEAAILALILSLVSAPVVKIIIVIFE